LPVLLLRINLSKIKSPLKYGLSWSKKTSFYLLLKIQTYRFVELFVYTESIALQGFRVIMTTVTPGTNSTIKGTNAETQFCQLIEYFQGLEIANNNTTSYVTGNYDSDDLVFNGDFTMPVKFTGVGLNFIGKTESFLSGTFNPGAGGTFTAINALDYFLQVLARILSYQNDEAKNPNKIKNVSASINASTGTLSGSFTMPFVRVITDTGVTITPAEYLLT